jgi:signal transduction histidine kinase
MSGTFLIATGLAIAAGAAILFATLWIRARRTIAERDAALNVAQEARGTFFDLVTHELRSPLSAILGYQELLEDGAYGPLDDLAAEAIARIGRSGRHLLHLIDGVVELGHIRSGKVHPDLGTVDLGVVIPVIAETFTTRAKDRGLEPVVHIPPFLPTIRSDRERLVRALDLLMTSAVKHPEDRVVTLRIDASDQGAIVRIEGMRVDTLHDVPDIASRLGLRLAVADGIAGVIGGRLDLDTRDDGSVRSVSFHAPHLPTTPLAPL